MQYSFTHTGGGRPLILGYDDALANWLQDRTVSISRNRRDTNLISGSALENHGMRPRNSNTHNVVSSTIRTSSSVRP